MKEFRNPINVHAPLAAYVHQIEVTGPERLLILSGQVGQNGDGSVPESAIEQLEIALENLKRNLQAANMDVTDLLKVTFYLVGDMDVSARRQVISNWFQGFKPCTTLLFIAALAAPIYKVEIDAWASKSD
jgi:enamine deaminase RidA (YjgF/YER057c/UK114 family)